MPNYLGALHGLTTNTTPPLPNAIYPGDKSGNLFNAEQPAAPQAGLAVALHSGPDTHPGTVALEGFFSGDPGVFEIDLQTADTDADAFYTQEGLGITGLSDSTAFTFRGEFVNVSANFARPRLKTRTNGVNLTCWITRK